MHVPFPQDILRRPYHLSSNLDIQNKPRSILHLLFSVQNQNCKSLIYLAYKKVWDSNRSCNCIYRKYCASDRDSLRWVNFRVPNWPLYRSLMTLHWSRKRILPNHFCLLFVALIKLLLCFINFPGKHEALHMNEETVNLKETDTIHISQQLNR